MPTLVITSLRGGMNDFDHPTSLADDQCTVATNVEFFRSALGERRRGSDAIVLTGSPLAACDKVVWSHRHLPTSDYRDAQYWALGLTGSTPVLAYKDTTWHTVTMSDALTVDGESEHQIEGVSLHGKLFIFYNSAVDRLHVWDGTSLRRVGLVAPSAAPTGANSGSGAFATTRYYRVRETVQASGTTTLRSEPSAVYQFSPSGTGSGVTVTKPATTNSDPAATHWELEASLDNSNFYVIATTVIGTSTAIDTTAAATGYGAFDLSEDIGDYLPPHSARHGLADEDRLVIFGSFENVALDSSGSWTPVFNATGVGNDERIPLDPVSVVNLDGFEGGPITDVGRWAPGELGIGKESHLYKMIRTGNRQRAYDAFAVSKEVGVLPGSMVEAVDEAGNAALYMLDPSSGPYRHVLHRGLQRCGRDIWNTWRTVNVDATKVPSRSLFYRTNLQVLWFVPTGSDNVPTIGLQLQTNEMRESEGGEARRGFSIRDGSSCAVLTACLFSSNIDDNTDRSRDLVPLIGLTHDDPVWMLDTTDADNGTEYVAQIRTRPYAPMAFETHFEIKSATLVAKAEDSATMVVSVVPDFGVIPIKLADDIDLTPDGDEEHVTRKIDDIGIAEMTVAQVDFADSATPGERWELSRFAMTVSQGQGS